MLLLLPYILLILNYEGWKAKRGEGAKLRCSSQDAMDSDAKEPIHIVLSLSLSQVMRCLLIYIFFVGGAKAPLAKHSRRVVCLRRRVVPAKVAGSDQLSYATLTNIVDDL